MKQSQGQSLIELIVALGMMSLLLVGLLALVSLSVRNSRLAQTQARAVALAQGGVELIRAWRDYSWTDLTAAVRSQAYELPENWIVETGLTADCVPDNYVIANILSRCVQLSLESVDSLAVTVTVYWQEGGQVRTSQQLARLTKWER